jgi:16S rRNA (cytidine1402-2'-O)-methyltransferase
VTGVLVLAATPIGALGDASPRLVTELESADVIAAEDTRRLSRLRSALGIETNARVVSYFEGNEERRTPELVAALQDGARVVLVTDAGTPSVSDPGYRLVAAAVDAGVTVTAVPGPSAVTTALAVSGLPVDRFCFEGFLPRKSGERARRLHELAGEPRTLVFFEAPHRLPATLSALARAFGPARRAVVCRELTKLHEEVRRGQLADLAAWATDGVRGEITLVVAGADPALAAAPSTEELRAAVEERVRSGVTRRTAVDAVAAEHGLPRRAVYAAATSRESAPNSGGPSSLG